MLEEKWASIEDFATLFQYLWYRDFPMDAKKAVGAGRADWTIHIGVVVRNIADIMGLVTRFERGGRKDAILRSTDGDEIAIEWEWGGVWGNELEKLKNHKIWPENKEGLKYAVFVTYTHARRDTPEIENVYKRVVKEWEDAKWPLLLILIDVEKSERRMRREFKNIQMSVFDKGERTPLRSAPAFPWEVAGTRWSYEMK
jgi:hypothetical protein